MRSTLMAIGFRLLFPALAFVLVCGVPAADAQQEETDRRPAKVDVNPFADADIARRLEGILASTGWFENPQVTVREGVVFLDGRALRREHREWAEQLAANTVDVTAVVNRLEVERSPWDLSPALQEVRDLGQEALKNLPLFAFGLLILFLFLLLSRLIATLARREMVRRGVKPLLSDVGAKALAIPVFLVGLYVVLKISGLSRLALTLLGGTGIAGLVIGIAFRDIMENFLASILISTRNPFHAGDVIDIEGRTGVVQGVTTRGTVLMDFEGNHMQIPNATVYKSTITNYTANPKRRMDFTVGIGYDASIAAAQSIALEIIGNHPAVLQDPEPLVLVENLGAATVNMRLYFWFDGTRYNGLKIKSALIRQVKRTFTERGISMPDEAREIIFPQEIPVRLLREEEQGRTPAAAKRPAQEPVEPVATEAEGDLGSEEEKISEQARSARNPEEGQNLL